MGYFIINSGTCYPYENKLSEYESLIRSLRPAPWLPVSASLGTVTASVLPNRKGENTEFKSKDSNLHLNDLEIMSVFSDESYLF